MQSELMNQEDIEALAREMAKGAEMEADLIAILYYAPEIQKSFTPQMSLNR